MSTALVPTLPGRPVWLQQAGTWICVSIHDRAYLAQRAHLRTAIKAAADHGRQALERAVAKYRRFLREETTWYEALALTPPDRLIPEPVSDERPRCAHGHLLGQGACLECRRWRVRERQRRFRRRHGRPPLDERLTCPHGHPRTPAYRVRSGGRDRCRACLNAYFRHRYAKRRGAAHD